MSCPGVPHCLVRLFAFSSLPACSLCWIFCMSICCLSVVTHVMFLYCGLKMVLEESSISFREVPSSISFSGSGFLATYELGVAQCFVDNAPWLLRKAPSILGASAGSLVAAAVACEINLITMRNEMLNFARAMKAFTLGPFNPSVDILHWLKYILHKYLPPDAHLLVNGRLAVAVTRLDDGEYTVITEYRSKDDVIQALLCSCFVPGYCGMLPPSLNGVHYMDGGFSQMQPVLALPCRTLTVSPFSGETDICPRDEPCMLDMVVTGVTLKGNLANGLRIWNALYPLKPDAVEQAYHSGYKDAFHFLLSNELLPNMKMITLPQELESAGCRRTKTPKLPETTSEDEMGTHELSFFQRSQSMQMNTSAELQSPAAEQPLSFDAAKNGFLTDLVLPMVLMLQTLVETKEIFWLLSQRTPVVAFWAWCSLRQFTLFFFRILFFTVTKNLKNRVLPIILKFMVMKRAQNEVQLKLSCPPRHKELSRSESVRFGGLRSKPPLRAL
ncbi:patatin-like phospholipase domain-containing protein 2 isoform X2 [Hippocampus zosterae]|uniref:patatin-like phospholipase domain-containing protein 2 isoform X2 n=1 Tax=Hippocampus zosterae TaxID=109293 RepID=UPI00223CD31F|nr:patatin-like phospholipase domain-containing protein 2 isoform X2 [Hippocampus zosterae]